MNRLNGLIESNTLTVLQLRNLTNPGGRVNSEERNAVSHPLLETVPQRRSPVRFEAIPPRIVAQLKLGIEPERGLELDIRI